MSSQVRNVPMEEEKILMGQRHLQRWRVMGLAELELKHAYT
jgi:hypothetical protein